MVAAFVAVLLLLALGAAGLVWGVRRDDSRRASPKRPRGGDAGYSLGDAGAYGAFGAFASSDGGCDVGDSGGSCGGD